MIEIDVLRTLAKNDRTGSRCVLHLARYYCHHLFTLGCKHVKNGKDHWCVFLFSFNSLVYLSRMARKLTIFCLSHDVQRPLITLGWFLSVLWTQQYKLDDIWATFAQILMLLFHRNLGVIIIWLCLLSLELGWDAGIVCCWKIGLTSAITFALYGHHPIFLSFSLSSTWCWLLMLRFLRIISC
jgi:hypothetical protein